MKRLLILLMISVLAGCADYPIPREVRKAQKEFYKERQNAPVRKQPDVILPPIETTPVMPNVRTLNTGNWGYSYLEIDKYEDFIEGAAERPVEVFVFDTGGSYDHDGVKAVHAGKSFTGEPLLDRHGHSTHVASTFTGRQVGRDVGICEPLLRKNLIRVRPYKVLSNSGSGSYSNITRAINEANVISKKLIEQGYAVVYNFSLGGGSGNSALDKALKEAMDLGVLVSVAASGNTGRQGVNYPGKSAYTEGIAAIDQNGRHARFSTTGPEVDFAFPGVGIYGAHLGNSWRLLSGTSMATPHAGAMAALLLSVYPDASAADVVAHMRKHATDKGANGKDDKYGYGVPKASDVFSEAPDEQPDNPSPDPDPDPEPEPPAPDPEPQPEETHTFTIQKQHTILWRTMSGGSFNRTKVSYTVSYTHTLGLRKGVADFEAMLDDFYQNRGYILRDGSDDDDAVFWAVHFLEMIEGRKGRDFDVKSATYEVSGSHIEKVDFDKRPTQREATEGNAITFVW